MLTIIPAVPILQRVRRAADTNAGGGPDSPASHWLYLAASAAVYLVLFVAYYPPTHGVEDEVGFINQALALSRGAVTPEGAGFSVLQDFRPYKGRMVGIRNPGRPLLSAPFVAAGGLHAVFLSGALVHLALTLAGALILVRLGASPLWASLLLWHPTLSLYSRTVMGDTAAGLALLAALLALIRSKRPGLWAGLAIGAAAVMRYQAGMVLPFFVCAILIDPVLPRRNREALQCLLAGSSVGILIVAYNFIMYGDATGIVKGTFGLKYVPGNLVFYSAVLLTMWPLMLLAPVLDRGRLRRAIVAVCAPTLAFFCLYYFHDESPGMVQTLVVGARLLQIALPAWIVAYCLVLDAHGMRRLSAVVPGRMFGALVAAGLIVLALLNGLMFERHQRHLENLIELREEITAAVPPGSLLLSNSAAWKLLGVAYPELPAYRLMQPGDVGVAAAIGATGRAWYISILIKDSGVKAEQPAGSLSTRHQDAVLEDREIRAAIVQHACEPLQTRHAELLLFRCPTGPGETHPP